MAAIIYKSKTLKSLFHEFFQKICEGISFGLTPSEYKKFKGLSKKNHNLRDHMTDLELIFAMLGEKVTTKISENEQPDTFEKNKHVAKRGGWVLEKPEKILKKNWAVALYRSRIFQRLPLKNG